MARLAVMPRVSRRGLNFDLNTSQYGAYNSAPAISFVFTRQMNTVRPVLVRSQEFTFLTTERGDSFRDERTSAAATIDPCLQGHFISRRIRL